MTKSPRSLTRLLLLPLSGAAALFAAAFLAVVDPAVTNRMESELRERGHASEAFIQGAIAERIRAFTSLAVALAKLPGVAQAFREDDAGALLHETDPLFAYLAEEASATELLLFDADNLALVRLGGGRTATPSKQPLRLSIVERAAATRQTQSGLAISGSGEAKLWVAHPVAHGGGLLGTILLSADVEHVLRRADERHGLRHLVLLDGQYLSNRRIEIRGSDPFPASDSYPLIIPLARAPADLPGGLDGPLRNASFDTLENGLRIADEDRVYYTGIVPLRDFAGDRVGHVVTLTDVTEEEALGARVATGVTLIAVVFGAMLFAMFYGATRKTERDLDRIYAKLEQSHARLGQALADWNQSIDAIDEPIFLHDADYRIVRANKAYADRAGRSVKQLIGEPYFECFPLSEGPLPSCREAMTQKADSTREEMVLNDGQTYISQGFPVYDECGVYRHSVHILRNVTEREAILENLRRENRARRIVSSSNQALIQAQDEQQLAQTICELITGVGAYRMAWVGLCVEGFDGTLGIVAASGVEHALLTACFPVWAEDSPPAYSISTGELHMETDLLADPSSEAAARLGSEFGCGSLLVLPLNYARQTFGVLVIGGGEANAFNREEVALLSELSADVAYGLMMLRSDDARRYAEHERLMLVEKLEASLEKTVQAMATALEARDPYTAGHQRRVADLAAAIAREMELPQEEVEAVHVAGIVHDIGKIYVPSEILSKPGQLSGLEFELVKTHAQVSYDILKEIDFPWPVAMMVYQHHERLNGSGYPLGCKGEEILRGARVLAVADVIEAMGTHRPYRPALTLDNALEEVQSKRGTHFDPEVVDACIRLFTRQGYALQSC